MQKKTNFKEMIKKSVIELGNSFKNKKIIWVLAYDLCFILIAGIILKISSTIMNWQMSKLGLQGAISGPTMKTFSPEIISQQLGAIKSLAVLFFIITLIVYLILILDYTLFRGWAWTKLLDKKPTKTYMKKFFLLNLIWVTIWTALFLLAVTTINQSYYSYLILIIAILYIHLTTVMHHCFTWQQEIKKAIGKAFTLGIGHIKYFIIPYIYIIIIYIIATKAVILIPRQSQTIAVFSFVILFMAWYKTYMNSVIKRTQKKR